MPGEARGACLDGGTTVTIAVRAPIPLGHKAALRDLAAGEPVTEYGESIGLARSAIAKGMDTSCAAAEFITLTAAAGAVIHRQRPAHVRGISRSPGVRADEAAPERIRCRTCRMSQPSPPRRRPSPRRLELFAHPACPR
jgi:hypothetical protein